MSDFGFRSANLSQVLVLRAPYNLSQLGFGCADRQVTNFRWSQQRAVEYLANYTTLPRSQIENEVKRYITIPGQVRGKITTFMVQIAVAVTSPNER